MDAVDKSFATATETSKLLITLATGVIAFCVTLLNPDAGKLPGLAPISSCQKFLLGASWLVLLICIGVGIWVQLAITHVLSQSSSQNPPNVWNMRLRFPYMLQISSFAFGMLLLVIYGGWRLAR